MSLIVVRKSGATIHMVSDTKLTYPEEQFPDRALAASADGVIKITILHPHICIAFAGEVEPVEEAIKTCRHHATTISSIKEYLLSVNRNTLGKTEFILCIGFPEYSIYEIKNMKIIQTNAAWIGSRDGFNIFQEKALKKSIIPKSMESILDGAMDYVLQSGRVPEVSGYRVSVSNHGNFFHYKNYMSTNMPSRTYNAKENQHVPIEIYGNAQEGGYAVNLCENGGRYDVVAIHVRQGEFGVLYEICNEGLLWPKVILNVDEHEFNDILYSRFGIQPGGVFSSLQKSYLNRGNRSFENNAFTEAIALYNKGLEENETHLRGVLLFKKGLSLLKLDRLNEACQEFEKAVRIDNNFDVLIQKELFSR